MTRVIELLEREINEQSKIKLDAEREKKTNNDVRFIASYSNKINKAANYILKLKKAIEILKINQPKP